MEGLTTVYPRKRVTQKAIRNALTGVKEASFILLKTIIAAASHCK